MTGGNVKGSTPLLFSPIIKHESGNRRSRVCLYRPVLAKAIHSLSRIGDDLYVEPEEDGVCSSNTVIYTRILPLSVHIVCVLPVGAHFASINITDSSFFSSFSLLARPAVCELLSVGICLLPVRTTFLQQVQTVFVYK